MATVTTPEWIDAIHRLKSDGNSHFQKGEIKDALQSYTKAIEQLSSNIGKTRTNYNDNDTLLLHATLLSNRSMCHLKQHEHEHEHEHDAIYLSECIRDCKGALDLLNQSSEDSNKLRSKLLYRRAKARFLLTETNTTSNATTSSDTDGNNEEEDDANKQLNDAAKDLLELLSIDKRNSQGTTLLRTIRAKHAMMQSSNTPVSKALQSLQSLLEDKSRIQTQTQSQPQSQSMLHHLKIIMGALTQDVSSASMELGRRNGVSILFSIASNRILPDTTSDNVDADANVNVEDMAKCRVLAIHALSAACSHAPLIRTFAHQTNSSTTSTNTLTQQRLATLVLESCSSNTSTNNHDIAVASIGLMLRLVIHLLHDQDNDDEQHQQQHQQQQPVDGPSVCRMACAALTSPNSNCQKAALDLLSAWTAPDMDAVAMAADAEDMYSDHSFSQQKQQQRDKPTEEEIRQMKPKELAAHKKRQYQRNKHCKDRSKSNSALFCDSEMTGGLSALLECAVRTEDGMLQRQCISTVSRLLVHVEDHDQVKALVGPMLGWKDGVHSSSIKSEWEEKEEDRGTTLTIEELPSDEEDDDGDEEEKESFKDDTKDSPSSNDTTQHVPLQIMETIMKKGLLTAALLLGISDLGVWALSEGWSNGHGLSELQQLTKSKSSKKAMSIASEIVSSAASVEKCRPILSTFIQNGSLQTLLSHDDKDISSGAASAFAKIGLADKAQDEGDVFELLEVAAGLLETQGVLTEADDSALTKKLTIPKKDSLSGKTKSLAGNGNRSKAVSASTSVQRGVEVLNYLASKTIIKEEIAHGYKSPLSSATVLEKLVELSTSEDVVVGSVEAYAIACIFSSLAVSVETLRNEAFIGKDITAEQYDQLQALGKTEEEKEFEKNKQNEDSSEAVKQRIRNMANKNVPRAMVSLMEGASDASLEQLVVGMTRMANEESCRGLMIQQGCLSSCIKLTKEKNLSEIEKKITRVAEHCIAKMLVTTNPTLLTVAQRMGAIKPLIKLVQDINSTDLQQFEALLSLTNIASIGDETKNRIVAERGISILSYAMFSEHEMVRRAATEAMSNLVPHPKVLEHLADPEKLKIWLAFASDFEDNFECARAAAGCLAMVSQEPHIASEMCKLKRFSESIRLLLECGNLELMHRILVVLLNLLDQEGEDCKKAVIGTGSVAFCEAYVSSYHNGEKAGELGFSASDRSLLAVTLDLAKEVVQRGC